MKEIVIRDVQSILEHPFFHSGNFLTIPHDSTTRVCLGSLRNENIYLERSEISKVIWSSCTEIKPDILEFANLMKKLVGILIVQACEMAAFIYQGYCIAGKSIEELSKEYHVDEETIQLIAQYYDDRIKS